MLTREQAIDLLKNKPLKYAHMLGFTKLTALNEEWLKDMLPGKDENGNDKKDGALQAHRLSYKTTCASITLARIIILLPNKRTLFLRKTDADVKEIINQVKKILNDAHSQYIAQCIYGTKMQITTSNAGEISTNLTKDIRGTNQLVGMGIGGSLTGKHFDYIFTDDISNINDRLSRAERDRTKLMYQELQNIKNRDGRIYNTLTPWHPEDVSSIMPEPKRYTCYDTGLITPEQLEEIKASMTRSLFAANYELKHVADDDVIFIEPQTGADPALAEQGNSHVDAAFYGEDYTAFTAVATHDGKFYVFGKLWRKHIDDVMDECVMWHEKFMCGKMYNELNADKGYVAKQFRNKGVKVSTYTESQNKYIKIVSYLKFEWKNVIFVSGTDDAYIDMICDYNENAEHDDAPDSLASLIRIMARRKNTADQPYQSIFTG